MKFVFFFFKVTHTRTRWVRMAKHFFRVSSHTHSATKRWCRVPASPLPDFHGRTATLRTRRPIRPNGPLSMYRAISHLQVKTNKRKSIYGCFNDVVLMFIILFMRVTYACVGYYNNFLTVRLP